jgi:GNAT superfamily N-acetyltransferase
MSEIVYAREPGLSVEDYVSVVSETTLGPTRPLRNRERIAEMLANANIIVTAREDGRCVGLARGLTDFAWVCFLGDLAVREEMQGRGVGTALMRTLREVLGERVAISLNAASEAVSYYDHVGPKLGLAPNPHDYYWPRTIGVDG